jgi:selenocysteine-specific elongation factor
MSNSDQQQSAPPQPLPAQSPHLIMGTAGHVDHGKTAIIKALTGVDCDTHKEEKARGITINLGFAHLDLPSGNSVGIVDVPGHKDFVHTMVGGASGIDFALLVVAADSGVMPQTREHLQVMDLLGIQRGLTVITRIDLAEEDIVLMAGEETRDLVKGTFLEGSPLINVSSITGEGIDELRAAIDTLTQAVPTRPAGEVFRMFIDRIFSVSGFGSVVTGSVSSGSLSTGDTAYLLPANKDKLRVRRIERHGQEVDSVVAGDRASINLVGLHREDFTRGMLVSDRRMRSTQLVDARIRLFPHARRLGLWNQVVFHLGTFENPARVHLLDKDALGGGETALAQIHFTRPCVTLHGDKFVMRNSSGTHTLGGGEIVDADPLHHRRRPPQLVENLAKVAEGGLTNLIIAEVRKQFGAVSAKEIADSLNIARDAVIDAITDDTSNDIRCYTTDSHMLLIMRSEDDKLAAAVTKGIAAYHARHPLEDRGRTADELMGRAGIERDTSGALMLRQLLDSMVQDGRLRVVGRTWSLAEHAPAVDPETKRQIDTIESYLARCGMKTPLRSELSVLAGKARMDPRQLDEILRHLVSAGKAYFIEGEYLSGGIVDKARLALLQALEARTDGMTVAEFRDLVKGNRKICLLLLAIYDKEGTTKRQDDTRVITDKGRAYLAEVA